MYSVIRNVLLLLLFFSSLGYGQVYLAPLPGQQQNQYVNLCQEYTDTYNPGKPVYSVANDMYILFNLYFYQLDTYSQNLGWEIEIILSDPEKQKYSAVLLDPKKGRHRGFVTIPDHSYYVRYLNYQKLEYFVPLDAFTSNIGDDLTDFTKITLRLKRTPGHTDICRSRDYHYSAAPLFDKSFDFKVASIPAKRDIGKCETEKAQLTEVVRTLAISEENLQQMKEKSQKDLAVANKTYQDCQAINKSLVTEKDGLLAEKIELQKQMQALRDSPKATPQPTSSVAVAAPASEQIAFIMVLANNFNSPNRGWYSAFWLAEEYELEGKALKQREEQLSKGATLTGKESAVRFFVFYQKNLSDGTGNEFILQEVNRHQDIITLRIPYSFASLRSNIKEGIYAHQAQTNGAAVENQLTAAFSKLSKPNDFEKIFVFLDDARPTEAEINALNYTGALILLTADRGYRLDTKLLNKKVTLIPLFPKAGQGFSGNLFDSLLN